MGNINTLGRINNQNEQKNCATCREVAMKYIEMKSENGDHCSYEPKLDTDDICSAHDFKICVECGGKMPKFLFSNCDLCKKTHCFRNTLL